IGGFIVAGLPLIGPSDRAATAVCISTTFFTNVVASSLAAGRIWWISRRASYVISRNSRRTYANLTAILVESGCIYPISIVVVLTLFIVPTSSTIAVLISIAPLYHIVGISPTLIIVRVGLGVSTDDVDKTITSVSCDPNDAERAHTRRQPLSTLRFNHATTVEIGLETRRRNDLDENELNASMGSGLVESRSDTTKV
ncbi:hypothetical protein K438DRAFT_1820538, partial [Mycena galopus ATCC 62051]